MKKINLVQKDIIHFVGIGGIGMSGLAQIMNNMGFKVQGSDQNKNKNTISCSKSGIKIFIDADIEIRANRRYKELKKVNDNIELENVKKQLIERDNRDYNRIISPLRPAENSYLLNTSKMDIEQCCSAVCRIIEEHSDKNIN